jgi:aspartokinase/homoserine dehydrogenase 1
VGVSVILISQASSEHSICFAVPEAQAALAQETVERAFRLEREQALIQRVERMGPCSILAAVGDRMVDTKGVAARFFSALSKAGINIRAIAQGASERNISAVIDMADSSRALRAVHAGFYLSEQTLSLGLIGPGLVGSTLLAQIAEQAPKLRHHMKVDLRVRGIMNSRRMLLGDPSIDLGTWRTAIDGPKAEPADMDAFLAHVRPAHLPYAAIVDASANEDIASKYLGWLERGIHVVTPNKRAGAGQLAYYQALRRKERENHTRYFYEATVGAGLPVISTLRDLIRTGDRIIQIEGVLSGTMSFVFNALSSGRVFSDVVREAKRLGYTEPDPRDDLSGRDVARKLVILAREIGRPLELSDVRIESLVPEALRGPMTVDAFLERLSEFDSEMSRLRTEATARGEVLRYVGVVGLEGPAVVELKRYPNGHPFARIAPGDNIFSFKTARYDAQPLIVQGPGAGPEVTAAGVFADMLRLMSVA